MFLPHMAFGTALSRKDCQTSRTPDFPGTVMVLEGMVISSAKTVKEININIISTFSPVQSPIKWTLNSG